MQKAFAIDDFVVNDLENLPAGSGYLESVLEGGVGLPRARVEQARRYGGWPVVSGLDRPSHKLTMTTYFRKLTAALRLAQRRDLLLALNPELEETVRLLVADQVAPAGLAFAFGPWDVYQADDGDWAVRDVLRTGVEAGFVKGAVHFRDGWEDRQRAVVVEEARTNQVLNPSAETTGNYAVIGTATISFSSDYFYKGMYSYTIQFGAVNDGINLTLAALANADHQVTFWRYGSGAVTLEVSLDGGSNYHSVSAIETQGSWTRYGVEVPAAQANGSTSLRIIKTSGTDTEYLDAIQVEEGDYPTTYIDGAQGPGYSWNSTAHASYSEREETTLQLDQQSLTASEAVAILWQPFQDYDQVLSNRFLLDAGDLQLYYRSVDYKFVLTDGTNTAESSAQNFEAYDWIYIAAEWGSDGLSLYIDGTLDGSDSGLSLDLSKVEINFGSELVSSLDSRNHCNGAIASIQFYESLNADAISAMAAQGALLRARWVDVLCEAAQPLVMDDAVTDGGIVSTLVLDGTPRWRSRDGDVAFLRVYDDENSVVVDVDSDDEVVPIIHITPKTVKSTDYAYKRWVPVTWKAEYGAETYPTMLGPSSAPIGFDTATLVTAGNMQADGDDLRVWVDGVEVDRWLANMNTANTRIWVNLDWAPGESAALSANIGAPDTFNTLDVDDDISGFPSEGILLINSEAMTYTGKNDSLKQFTGVTRAERGTSAGAHTAGDTVYWIQHDIWMLYGNASSTAPDVDDDYEPAFELDLSTNDSWVYEEFGEADGLRAGQWMKNTVSGTVTYYGGNRGASADPWIELGILADEGGDAAYLQLYNPCGITAANFTNGEKYSGGSVVYYVAKIVSSGDGSTWEVEYTIPDPSSEDTWESWSRNETLDSGSYYVGLAGQANGDIDCYIEAADCTVTLNSTYTPDATVGSEQGSYSLDCTITNNETNEAIKLSLVMQLDQTVKVDTEDKTVTLLDDGSRQMQALTLAEGARRKWLRLVRGENTLVFEDTGTTEVEVDIYWNRRDWE